MRLVLFFHGEVSEQSARNVQTLCLEMLQKGCSGIALCISSQGGDVNGGLGLFNFLRMLPVPIHTHNYGLCGSIAATAFLAGSTRTCEEASAFVTHAATYSTGPNIGEIAPNTDLIAMPFRTVAGWDDARIAEHFSSPAETRLTAQQAKALGLVTDVAQFELQPGDVAIAVSIP